ncbi:MAG: cupin domain-containing protein [Pseudomonadales bacterium]|nr:cupin domain-containing protein [Pseudomonadales bacterium]
MSPKIRILIAAFFVTALASAGTHAATVEAVFSKALADIPGREATVVTVEYQPGEASPLHRHNAHTIVYVLEGSIVMQVKGGPLTTVSTGEVFYETPDDIHTVSKNASTSDSAKFLVLFIKQENAPPTVPVAE